MTFVKQPATPDGQFVVDAERSIKARVLLPYKSVADDEIAHMLEVTHANWMLMTPIKGRSFDITRRLIQVGEDDWVPEIIRGPNARIELEFASQLGLVSEPDEDGVYVTPSNEDALPRDIAGIIAQAASTLWATPHFEMNSGWNAS